MCRRRWKQHPREAKHADGRHSSALAPLGSVDRQEKGSGPEWLYGAALRVLEVILETPASETPRADTTTEPRRLPGMSGTSLSFLRTWICGIGRILRARSSR